VTNLPALLSIRPAVLADAPGIARVHVESWRTTYRGIMPDAVLESFSLEKRTAAWERHLSDAAPPSFTFAAVRNDDRAEEIVGWATGGPARSGEGGFSGELAGIYLLQEARGRGIGSWLVSRVAEELLERGFDSMIVWALAENPYRRFYEKLGGAECARKTVERGGKTLEEVAYGWPDVRALIRPEKEEVACRA
jgi:GNAT superfamily N-acetyltransferase